jgi:hypothetical protein
VYGNAITQLRRTLVERLHLRPLQDIRTGRDCQFCRQSDPEFEKRNALDRLVRSERNHTATAHMSENGYIKHRLLEIDVGVGLPLSNTPSA